MSSFLLISTLRNALGCRRGATAIEYGLIAALISVAIAGVVGLIGGDLTTTFNAIQTALKTAG